MAAAFRTCGTGTVVVGDGDESLGSRKNQGDGVGNSFII